MSRLAIFVLFIALFGLTSCGSTPASTAITCSTSTSSSSTATSTSTCTDPVTNISLTISPATITVNVVETQQFTATLTGGTNTVVTWSVNNLSLGNDTVGRIDSNGFYHAPGNVPPTNPVMVTATSFEDSKLSVSATVTIAPAPVVTITSPASPPTVASGSGNTVNFAANESGGTTNSVFWEVGPVGGIGILGGNATLGTIDANGLYTPPPTPPIGSTVVVTAVAQDAPNSTASMNVTISGYSTSSLQGQFAFSVAGTNASGPFFRAGSFEADGSGTLHGGFEDINDSSGTSTASFAGSYTVAADGRGTLQFDDGATPTNFNFVFANGTQLQIIGFDTTGTATGGGSAQTISTFATNALNGTYVFDFNGTHNSNPISEIGEFTADGAGNITGGSIDVNDNGNLTQLQIIGNTAAAGQPPVYPSTYTSPANSNGRGTLTLVTSGPTLHFSFYVVSRGSAKFVGTDSQTAIGALAGATEQQAPNVAFNQISLKGSYAFLLAGSGAGGTYASAGSFSADGNSDIISVVLDENISGTPSPNVVLSGTNYTVASNGRGTLTFSGGRTYVFYFGPTGTAVFQETDSSHGTIVSDGTFALQQNTSFALTQIAGTNAFYTHGVAGASAEVITGEIATSATTPGVISSGAVDVNAAGATSTDVPITSGSYSTSSSAERGTLELTFGNPLSQTRNYAVYVVSPTQVFLAGIDSGRLAAGQLLRQF